MDNGRELIDALTQVYKERGIDKELIFEAIEASLVSACKKQYSANANLRVTVDRLTGQYTVLAAKQIVETVEDPHAEMTLDDARLINRQLEMGDTVEVVVTPKDFGRIAAQTAKQIVVQKFREAEREVLFNEFTAKIGFIVTGTVQRRDRRSFIISAGRLDVTLPHTEQIPKESFNFQDRVKVLVTEVKQSGKGPVVTVSRAHADLVKRLFEQEVPEVYDGTVEIRSISREAGSRTKMAVYSADPNVDPIGSCVGHNGFRVNLISQEMRGEKLDIIQWSADPRIYIAAALSPSKVIDVAVNPDTMAARVVVPDHQLSLAIGKEGQNVRLAARLTGWRIDIKNESQARNTDFLIFPVKEVTQEEIYTEAYDDDDYYDDDDAYYDDDEAYGDEEYDDDDEYYDEEEYDDQYYDDEYDDEQADGGIEEAESAEEADGIEEADDADDDLTMDDDLRADD